MLPWHASGLQKTYRHDLEDEHPRVIFISSRVPAAEVCLFTNDQWGMGKVGQLSLPSNFFTLKIFQGFFVTV